MLVQSAIRKHLREKENRSKWRRKPKGYKPKIWAGDLGGCRRKSMLRILGEKKTVPFSDDSLGYMRQGVVLEDETASCLDGVYKDRVTKQLSLKNDYWSGKPDFVIDHKTSNPIIIEHKVTGENYFKNESMLPKRAHVGQLCLYGYLYEQLFNVKPKMVLYYRGWGHYAEFEVTVKANMIVVGGFINDVAELKTINYDVMGDIKKFQEAFERIKTHPEELPPKIKKTEGCQFAGKPSCSYYYSCWEK